MFVVYTINNIIVIKPAELSEGSHETLYKALQAKYLFKILENEGLCVEIISFNIKECVVVNGQGDYQFDVAKHICDQLIFERACKNEILIGQVEKCLPDGIIATLGFTEVFIPASSLNQPCRYDKKEKIWIWMYENFDFLYKNGDEIKFQIESTHFQKTALEVDDKTYHIIGNCNADGLGMLSFWNS